MAFNCHCRDCQRASGRAFASILVVAADSFTLHGEPAWHAVESDSGYTMRRGFCRSCGSPLLIREPHRPRIVLVHAASLDEPSCHVPALDIYVERAQPWDAIDPALPKIAAMPPLPDTPLLRICPS